jgi:hypothetical protein
MRRLWLLKIMRRLYPILPVLFALASPSLALASTTTETLSEIVGLFNIFVGLMLVLAIVIFVAAIIVWIVRLGTWPTYRDDAIKMMEWAVAILFVDIVLLGAVQYVQRHTHTALVILGLCVILLVLWILVQSGAFSSGEEKEEH